MARLLIGDEPYMIDVRIKTSIKKITNRELNVLNTTSFDESIVDYCNTYPFMDNEKLVIYKPNELKSELLLQYLKNESSFTELLIAPASVDKRSKVFKLFKSNNAIETENKLNRSDILDYIILVVQKLNGSIERTVAQVLVDRLNYHERKDITIYDIRSSVNKLVHYDSHISEDTINQIVEKNLSDKVFTITKHLFNNEPASAFEQLNYAIDNGQNAIGFLSLLLRNFRIMYKMYSFKNTNHNQIAKQIGIPPYQIKQFSSLNYSIESITKAINICNDKILGIKNGLYSPVLACNMALSQVCYTIA
ncbi:DNA polymerase III subunit delta [Vallitalea guaymasensis]|uniref:DNA polymerase III subunit delta n=1 Tax=Vallitalea guaymasensis TaxID=1185412 RepID=UPI000DE1F949|nr:hypothetical protein [Vallitalea guaymasensis]